MKLIPSQLSCSLNLNFINFSFFSIYHLFNINFSFSFSFSFSISNNLLNFYLFQHIATFHFLDNELSFPYSNTFHINSVYLIGLTTVMEAHHCDNYCVVHLLHIADTEDHHRSPVGPRTDFLLVALEVSIDHG